MRTTPSNRVVSVGTLRQNPTPTLRKVREGAEFRVTDRGVVIARLCPAAPDQWVPGTTVMELLSALGPDPELARDIASLRESVTIDDAP